MALYPQKIGRFYRIISGCFALFFLFRLLTTASAQVETLVFHRLTTADGLTSQDDNYFLFNDSRNFLWIGSASGLNRYDGDRVVSYLPEPADSNSLADPNLLSPIFEDNAGDLWFSSRTALHRYRRKTDDFERHYIYRKGIPFPHGYRLLHVDPSALNIWLAVQDSLFLYQPEKEKEQQLFLGKLYSDIRTKFLPVPGTKNYILCEPAEGKLRIRTFENGIDLKGPDHDIEILEGFAVNSIFVESERILWATSKKGLIRVDPFKPEDKKIFSDFKSTKLENLNGIQSGSDGNFFISTLDMGLYHFDKAALVFDYRIYQYHEDGNRPFAYRCDKLYLDPNQNLWVSSGGNGIYFSNLGKRKFKTLLNDPALQPEAKYVQSLAEDPYGRLWCLTKKGIIVLEKNGEPAENFNFLRSPSLPFYNAEPFYMNFDKDWNLWVCSQNGLYKLAPGKLEFVRVGKKSGESADGYTYFYQTKKGRRLVSSLSSGIFEIEEEKGESILRNVSGLHYPESGFTVIWEDFQGKLYLCQDFQLIRLFSEQNNSFIPEFELPLSGGVWGFAENIERKKVWIASDQGIWAIDAAEPKLPASPELRFTDRFPRGILHDKTGSLWISTTHGIIRYEPETKRIRSYGMADGLQGLEFNFSSFLAIRDGNFAFGGMNGINIFDPSPEPDLAIKAKPGITDILIFEMPLPEGISCSETGATNIGEIKKLILRYAQRTLTFRFAAFEYSDPGTNQYRYRMHGIDDSLVLSGTQNVTRYPNLAPGDYRFEVQASNSDGIWSDQFAGVDIVIKPPWYQTWWARSVAAIILAGILYSLYRVRVRELEFRRKEAEAKQLMAETETAVTRLQMNPHFIGNIMVSIQNCIMEKDMEVALGYLGRVNRMMRLLLEYAEKPYIEVSDEAEVLKSYLEVQQIRKDFDFSIHLSDDLEAEEALIPTMVLQPFVENSIKHGFQGNSRKWRIDINFWLADHSLYCSLQDNGIGRENAGKQNAYAREFESKSISITERRLSLIKPQNGVKATFSMEDLKNPSGMKVLLRFPVFPE